MKYLIAFVVFAALVPVLGAKAQTQPNDTPSIEDLLAYTEGSTVTVDHSLLTRLLNIAVVEAENQKGNPVGPTYKDVPRPKTGTRISRSRLRTGVERANNQIPYDFISRKFLFVLNGYVSRMSRIDPTELDRNEQLAYWLNLYNAVMLRSLLSEYPFRKLKRVLFGEDGEPGILKPDQVTVNNVSLSLDDIENRIILREWQDPLVIYGLFKGTIFGPALRKSAYEGDKVWRQLESNARNFIAAPMGVSVKKDRLKISYIYTLYDSVFDSEDELKAHLAKYVDDDERERVLMAHEVDTKRFRWRLNNIRTKDWMDLQGQSMKVRDGNPFPEFSQGLGQPAPRDQ